MSECVSRGFYPDGKVPYGYKIIKVRDGITQRSKLVLDPVTAPIVKRIFTECIQGKGLKEIARGLNHDGLTTRTGKKWGTTSLHHLLRNEIYAGVLIWDGRRRRKVNTNTLFPVRVDGACPAIIDWDTFNKAKNCLTVRAPRVTHPGVVHSEYILSGLMYCQNCGTGVYWSLCKIRKVLLLHVW